MPFLKLVVVGVKGTVIAFDSATGERRWTQQLKSGLGDGFVSVLVDGEFVYAHTHGQLFCLSLSTGERRWHDELAGLGYGIASLAVPGSSSNTMIAAALDGRRRADAAATSTSTTTPPNA